MSLCCCLKKTIPGQTRAAGLGTKSGRHVQRSWLFLSLLFPFWKRHLVPNCTPPSFLDTHISLLYTKWYYVIVSRGHWLINQTGYFWKWFHILWLYKATEYFRGKLMTPLSYLLGPQCSTEIIFQVLGFQILIFRLSWSIFDAFWHKKHTPLSPTLSIESLGYTLIPKLSKRKKIVIN